MDRVVRPKGPRRRRMRIYDDSRIKTLVGLLRDFDSMDRDRFRRGIVTAIETEVSANKDAWVSVNTYDREYDGCRVSKAMIGVGDAALLRVSEGMEYGISKAGDTIRVTLGSGGHTVRRSGYSLVMSALGALMARSGAESFSGTYPAVRTRDGFEVYL